MKFPFFRHKRAELSPPLSAAHLRVADFADRLNNTITRLEEERLDVIEEIADKREQLRQIEAVLAATRAGLTHVVDDPSLPGIAANEARSHIAEQEFVGIEREFMQELRIT